MTKIHTAIAGVAVTLMLLAACDDGATSPPTTTLGTPSSSSSSQPSASVDPATQAPKVQNPLDASSFVLDPCKSLTEAQQQQFGLRSGKITDAAVEGPSCFYKQTGKTDVAVVFASKIKGGLSSRYFEHSRGYWGYWEPTTVDGYPAVGFVAILSNPDTQGCHFGIGVTDSLYFWVTADDNPGDSRCTASKNVASAVLATIKIGS